MDASLRHIVCQSTGAQRQFPLSVGAGNLSLSCTVKVGLIKLRLFVKSLDLRFVDVRGCLSAFVVQFIDHIGSIRND